MEIELIKALNEKNKEENFTVSPLGIEILLSLLINGAEGETQGEILKLLKYEDIEKANATSKEIITQCQNNEGILNIATAILTKINAKKTFIDEAHDKYKAKVELLKHKDQINKWAQIKTKNTIQQIIETLSPDVIMVLLNALYLEADWEIKFDKNLSYDRDFYNLDKKSWDVRTSMLFHRGELLNYYENDEIQAVKLNYKNTDSIHSIVILPKEINLNFYLNFFTKGKYEEIIQGLNNEKVKVNFIMPKFEMEYKIEFNDFLKNLGMIKAFTEEAELEGIYSPISNQPMYVGQVLQKNFIKVNEQGTKAGSVTELDVILECYIDKDPEAKDFIANKPFLFIIRDEKLPKDRDVIFFTKFCKVEKKN